MKAVGLLVVLALALSGCTRSIHFTLPSGPLSLSFTVNGASTKRCAINQDSEQYKTLSTWLMTHQDGWQSSIVTYVPSLVVTGDGFNLNFLHSVAVLNYAGSQFTQQVSPSDYAYLVCAGNP
ncbi:hypothetical protein [Rhodanobacter sp. DHB23]|uniref:hypothetical protein n=1 Tax=Rhodanobacter sp. DHB23 TaxID=2775923 RepID=UPI00177BE8AD|nr:hypothetical protein [Rhodanobacter sp. DHB23]MBD8872230.1 hypothetical protein [Rhodanobacter sp. DHB23]